MGTCKKCGEVAGAHEIKNGLCLKCQNVNQKKNSTYKIKNETHEKSLKSLKWLHLTSWIILISTFVAAISIILTMSYIEVPYQYISGSKSQFNIMAIVYGIAIMVNGIFFSSLGFTVAYIANNISKNNE